MERSFVLDDTRTSVMYFVNLKDLSVSLSDMLIWVRLCVYIRKGGKYVCMRLYFKKLINAFLLYFHKGYLFFLGRVYPSPRPM
jgi:hypothetical protein